jgi:hypothetical protein
MRHDFTSLLYSTREGRLERLATVQGELAGLYEEQAMLWSQEKRAKIEGFLRSEESSVAGREREADASALDITATAFEVRGAIMALEAERDLIYKLLGDA